MIFVSRASIPRFVGWMLWALLAGLAACADMSKTECAQADWRELGREDAMGGQTLARFERRSEACRKNGLPADRAQYEAGHAQGQAAYCTSTRGRNDALAGQEFSAVCTDPVGDPYRQGHAAGLQQFCTAASGYEYGRKGQVDRHVCPPELAGAFQIGFRMGHELFDLNGRLAEIQKAASDERAVLADAKSPLERRDAANRHLGQLDADEAATRNLIRQAELAALSLGQSSVVMGPAPLPSTGVEAEWLVGHWRLSSMSFRSPVDLNHDGVKSADPMNELSPCQRDRQLDLEGDQRALLRTGVRTQGCKPDIRTLRWRADEGMRQEVQYENGRRIMIERPALYLRLRGGRDDDLPEMVVESVDATYLIVRTEMSNSQEPAREAVVTYRRVGR